MFARSSKAFSLRFSLLLMPVLVALVAALLPSGIASATAARPAISGVSSARTAVAPAGPVTPGAFGSVAPARLLDTRPSPGVPDHAVPGGGTVAVQVSGRAGVPASGVSAVVLNVTALSAKQAGYLIGWADGTPRVHASMLNFAAGQGVANEVVLPVGADGKVALYNGAAGSVELLVDVSGYYLSGVPTASGAFGAVAPARLLDTRPSPGVPDRAVPGGGTVTVKVTGTGGVPASGVSAVVLNVTALSAKQAGYLIGWADGTPRVHASMLNFAAGQGIANEVVLPVGADGKVALYNGSAGSVELLADVSGYYLSRTPTVAGTFGSAPPARLLDTRPSPGVPDRAVPGGGTVTVAVTGTGGVPSDGVSAVVLNVTALSAKQAGYLIGWADGTPRVHASMLNFAAGQGIANEVVLPVGADGKVALYNGSAGSVELLADVSGYFLSGTAGSGLGNDISWPQCGKSLPSGQAFGIVGINDGLPNDTNPCLAQQLNWAQGSTGGTAQPVAGVYVNTANPGLQSSSWPTSNNYPGSTPVSNPYGTCTGADTTACAYMYGYAKAYDDIADRGVPTPTAFRWWLDVETSNSWEANKAANVAVLEGMTRYFVSIKLTVGVYSTTYQWGVIAGTVDAGSNLRALPNWLAGPANLADAQAACHGPALMPGAQIFMVQYQADGFDFDASCTGVTG